MSMFNKVLIANRGEIAVRIAQTLQEMGIRAAAVYSDPDRGAPHVLCADESYHLPGAAPAETYLQAPALVEIARTCGADAVHPGYGFLSENAGFARLCREAGLVFIGPSTAVIRDMGDKVISKQRMIEAGVPVVPGWAGGAEAGDEVLQDKAAEIGYPLLVKAAAGGGGKGMRVVEEPAGLLDAVRACRREAAGAFGDSRIFLEKYLPRARHVEIQIFGDEHGHVVHMFERECSVQRRHQKIVEEAPSPALDADLRQRMGAAAVQAAVALGYSNAGTVEFLLDESGAFYFLEVNTRLQVEHPVTEMTTDLDLVRLQVAVAAGHPLPFSQADLAQRGHALECRIYAEDPQAGFLPSTGRIEHYAPPAGPGIRVDSGVAAGSSVHVHYDPLLAKVIVRGATRSQSIDKMLWALEHFVILGVSTNIAFLRGLLNHSEFQAGRLHTRFLEAHCVAEENFDAPPDEAVIAAALASLRPRGQGGALPRAAAGPWQTAGGWRMVT